MTTKTDEQERAEFEAWLRERKPDMSLKRYVGGRYMVTNVYYAWEAFQAGRAALQSQHRGGYAGVTVWVGQIGCTKIIPKIQYKTSNADELLRHFEAARLAIDHARRDKEGV